MLKAKHHFIIHPFFQYYTRYLLKRRFNSINLNSEVKTDHRPVLLISNHTSWWDGFWVMYINLIVLHKKFHFMMLEDQLRKFWFFNYTGGFSVNKNSKSIIQTLKYTSELLTDTNNMVLIFPQGEIQSSHNQNIKFQKGIERVLNDTPNSIQVVFQVNLLDYFSSPKPGIYFYLKEYTEQVHDLKSIETAYNSFYKSALDKQYLQKEL